MTDPKPDSPLPWFPFYQRDFWGDENVMAMNDHEIVAYLRLLTICWEKGSIPDNIAAIGGICRMVDATAMAQAWHRLSPCFIESESEPGRLENPRMTAERKAAYIRAGKQIEKSRKGGIAKALKHTLGMPQAELGNAKTLPNPASSQLPSEAPKDLPKSETPERAAQAPHARKRASPGSSGRGQAFEVPEAEIPEPLRRDDVIEAWRFFELHRREIKKPVTPQAGRMALKKLAGWGADRALAAINHTIASGWTGLREPDGGRGGGGQAKKYISPNANMPDPTANIPPEKLA